VLRRVTHSLGRLIAAKQHGPSSGLEARSGITFAYLGLVAFLVGVTDYFPDLSNRYRFVDDVQAHIFWAYRFQDPGLFPDDIYADYYSSMMAPAGFRLLYFGAAQVMDPLLFSKLLPFGLLAILVAYAYRLGRALEPRWGGILAGLLILEYSGNCRGGMPRSFFLALLVPHVFYLARRQFTRASAVLALQGLFEPVVFCLGFGLQGVSLLRDLMSRRAGALSSPPGRHRAPLVSFLAATLFAGAIVWATHILYRPGFVGPAFSHAETLEMADFRPGGREAFFDPDPVQFYLRSDSSGIGWHPRLIKLVLAVAALMVLLRTRFFLAAPIIFDIVAVSLLLFALSHLVFPRLYFPNRYMRYTLPLAAILLIACHGRAAAELLLRRWPGWLRLPGKRVWWGAAGAGLLLIVVLTGAVRTVKSSLARANPPAAGLYEFLATLPKASVIGGTPKELDAVPLLAQRKIFWHAEFHAPFFKGYYREVERRRRALVGLEARDFRELEQFCHEFGVTHFVFDRSRPLPLAIPERQRLFEDNRFLVRRCGAGERVS
jgi:hypothetical protein